MKSYQPVIEINSSFCDLHILTCYLYLQSPLPHIFSKSVSTLFPPLITSRSMGLGEILSFSSIWVVGPRKIQNSPSVYMYRLWDIENSRPAKSKLPYTRLWDWQKFRPLHLYIGYRTQKNPQLSLDIYRLWDQGRLRDFIQLSASLASPLSCTGES